MSPDKDKTKVAFFSPSTLIIIIINGITLFWALRHDDAILTLFLMVWAENLIRNSFQALLIFFNKQDRIKTFRLDTNNKEPLILPRATAALHYWSVVFFLSLVGPLMMLLSKSGYEEIFYKPPPAIDWTAVGWFSLMYFIHHLITFITKFKPSRAAAIEMELVMKRGGIHVLPVFLPIFITAIISGLIETRPSIDPSTWSQITTTAMLYLFLGFRILTDFLMYIDSQLCGDNEKGLI